MDLGSTLSDINLGLALLAYRLETGLWLRNGCVADLFDRTAARWSAKEAIRFHSASYSFAQLDNLVCRTARVLRSQAGVQEGDRVVVFMGNRPEYIVTVLACAKLGATAALINSALAGDSLHHAVSLAATPPRAATDTATARPIGAAGGGGGGGRLAAIVTDQERCAGVDGVDMSDCVPAGVKRCVFGAQLPAAKGGGDAGAVVVRPPMLLRPMPRHGAQRLIKDGGLPSCTTPPPSHVPSGWIDLTPLVEAESTGGRAVPKRWRANSTPQSTYALIYTSGTTGRSKAARIHHLRLFMAAVLFGNIFGVRVTDRIYCCLPLYHASACLIGLGLMMYRGSSMVLREKFSASAFWTDCVKHDVTVIQYIGELLRFLTNAPAPPAGSPAAACAQPGGHRVRLAIGNGLRPDVWPTFQTRFGVPEVGEFYAATEGTAGLFNHCTSRAAQGPVGRMGIGARMASGMKLLRFDEDTQEPWRDPATGLCAECGLGEPGELVSRIVASDPIKKFEGYHGNDEASASKVLKDVLRPGDAYFRTGDLLKLDRLGYYWFVDRIGDTFRWQGENVATTDVEEAVGRFGQAADEGPGVTHDVVDCVAYGVQVPHRDGRAGMVALSTRARASAAAAAGGGDGAGTGGGEPHPDLRGLLRHLQTELPAHAVPRFVRLLGDTPLTGTFKHQKPQLRKAGAVPELCEGDPVFMLQGSDYVRLTQARWQEVAASPSARL